MSAPVLLVEKSEGIATLILNRPESRNALSSELLISLVQALDELSTDADTGVVIVSGAGKAFCAGLDLDELTSGATTLGGSGQGQAVASLFTKFLEFDRPIIGAINGAAVGGGFELALTFDILIASSEAVFGAPHARIGYVPGGGLSQKLPRLIGIGRAKELAFTGNFLTAAQALEWGLVNRVVPPDELLPVCMALGGDILSCVPDAVREIKRLIDRGYGISLSEGLELEAKTFAKRSQEVTSDIITSRRQGVQERGQKQKNKKQS